MLLSEYLECCTYFLTSCNNFVVALLENSKEKVNSKKQSHFNYSRSSNQKEERERENRN